MGRSVWIGVLPVLRGTGDAAVGPAHGWLGAVVLGVQPDPCCYPFRPREMHPIRLSVGIREIVSGAVVFVPRSIRHIDAEFTDDEMAEFMQNNVPINRVVQ